MRRAVVGAAGMTWVCALLVACQANVTAPRTPSEDEARAFLARLVQVAETRDVEAVCRVAGSNCRTIVETAGGEDAIPSESPTVLETYVVPTRHLSDGKIETGGRALVVCGVDGLGQPYRTDMLVFESEGSLHAINGVYWSGAGLAEPTAGRPRPHGSGRAVRHRCRHPRVRRDAALTP